METVSPNANGARHVIIISSASSLFIRTCIPFLSSFAQKSPLAVIAAKRGMDGMFIPRQRR
jgi:hypothetical protein